ncbi:hypothetical protein AX17_002770 [Amanita inopinata Kibby_2008]|nr:hypothetical protein AX17_002770 [Amanita inopinata Kibby_2008]
MPIRRAFFYAPATQIRSLNCFSFSSDVLVSPRRLLGVSSTMPLLWPRITRQTVPITLLHARRHGKMTTPAHFSRFGTLHVGARPTFKYTSRYRLQDTASEKFGKDTTWLLRYGAKSVGLYVRPDGFVRIRDILGLWKYKDFDMEMFKKFAIEDERKRFEVRYESYGRLGMSAEEWLVRVVSRNIVMPVCVWYATISLYSRTYRAFAF